MKIAICKGGTNITFNEKNKTAANADILYALRQLEVKDHEVSIVTQKTRNTKIPNVVKFVELSEARFDDYDVVMLFNFSINFFGGADNPAITTLYRKLAQCETPIAYIQTDGAMPFIQLWPSIQGRDWKVGTEKDYYIDPSRVTILTQGRKLEMCEHEYNIKANSIIGNFLHYPWYETILAKHKEIPYIPFKDRDYSLAFGGAIRNSHKEKKLRQFYMDDRFKVLMFGGAAKKFNHSHITSHKAVPYQEMVNKMSNSRGTVIVGDKHYNGNYFTLRMYEAILANCQVFIDEELDPYHEFYGSDCDNYITKPSQIKFDEEHSNELNKFKLASYNYGQRKLMLESLLEGISNA